MQKLRASKRQGKENVYSLGTENLFFFFSVPPMIWVQNQLVGAQEGQQLTLECLSEAYPKSINYWTRDKDEIVPQGRLKQ